MLQRYLIYFLCYHFQNQLSETAHTHCRARLAAASRLLLWLDKQQAAVCIREQTQYTEKRILRSWTVQLNKRKRNFLIQFQAEQIIIQRAWHLTAMSSPILHLCLLERRAIWECTRLKEHTRLLSKHVADVAHLSPARPPHMRDLYKSCHRNKSDTQVKKKNIWMIPACRVQGRSQYKQDTPVRVNRGNNGGDHWNVLPQQKPLKKRQESLWCLPSFVMLQGWLGPVLALHPVLFSEGLVCSRLLR